MEINVAKISKNEGLKINFELTNATNVYEIEFCGEKLKTLPSIQVKGSAVNYEGKILVEMAISAQVERTCSRCLETFVEAVEAETELTFVNKVEDCKDDYFLYNGDKIEILDFVLGEIAAELTMKPLCGDECNGLCPICGKNKNTNSCACKDDEIDSRLQILGKLLDTKQGGV